MVKQWTGCLVLALACTCGIAAVDEKTETEFDWRKASPIRALPYGNALFEYYRGHRFEAITALNVAEQRQQLGPHGREALALLGSMQLSYGMLEESERVLTHALQQHLPVSVRENVLVSLARLRFRAGDYGMAMQRMNALPQISQPALADEVRLMRASILLSQNEASGAAEQLQQIQMDTRNKRYALFNLGVAQLRTQHAAAAQQSFNQLLLLPTSDPQERALRDRTYVALGYEQLRSGNYTSATDLLRRVRLTGPYANKALLGMGWSQARQQDYQGAIAFWDVLAKRSNADLSVQEGRLALPYAYQQVQALNESLMSYSSALQSFDMELQQIDHAIQSVRDGDTLRSLLARLPKTADAAAVADVSLSRDGEHIYLERVLISHTFNESFRRYQELQKLRDNLADWQRRLPVYNEMLTNHQLRFREKVPAVDSAMEKVNVALWSEKLQRLREQVQSAKADEQWPLLLSEKERSVYQRLQRIQLRVKTITQQQPLSQPVLDKVRLMSGSFIFDVARVSAERQWQMQRSFNQAEVALQQLKGQRARLLTARETAGGRFNVYEGQIEQVQVRVQRFSDRTEAALVAEQQRLTSIALNELQAWRKQLMEYRFQAQLAMARLQDRASKYDDGARP